MPLGAHCHSVDNPRGGHRRWSIAQAASSPPSAVFKGSPPVQLWGGLWAPATVGRSSRLSGPGRDRAGAGLPLAGYRDILLWKLAENAAWHGSRFCDGRR